MRIWECGSGIGRIAMSLQNPKSAIRLRTRMVPGRVPKPDIPPIAMIRSIFVQFLRHLSTFDPTSAAGHHTRAMYRPSKRVKPFDFPPGRTVAGKYEIERLLGSGWEGEVYVIRE